MSLPRQHQGCTWLVGGSVNLSGSKRRHFRRRGVAPHTARRKRQGTRPVLQALPVQAF